MKQIADYFIGLPQWQHDNWDKSVLAGDGSALHRYARYFNSVEGNTTFYGVPRAQTVMRWLSDTPDDFRFCFKFRQEISHKGALRAGHPKVLAQLEALEPLASKIGLYCLQLPQSFGPDGLEDLEYFLSELPAEFNYSVEVRNLAFFEKGMAERSLNRLLMRQRVNRVMFDTRSIFASIATDASTLDAQQKKPRVPLHVIATGQQPQVRLITPIHYRSAESYVDQWVAKVCEWLSEDLQPFIFFHTPDNKEAPELARWFVEKLEARRPDAKGLKRWPDNQMQKGLF